MFESFFDEPGEVLRCLMNVGRFLDRSALHLGGTKRDGHTDTRFEKPYLADGAVDEIKEIAEQAVSRAISTGNWLQSEP